MACNFSHVYSLWILWQGMWLLHALIFHMTKPVVFYSHYFNFLIFIHFIKQITLKQSLAQRLKVILKFSSIKRQINIEFNANFVLLYFLSDSSIKIWLLYLKNLQKNNRVVHLRFALHLSLPKPFQYQETSCLGTKKNLST